MCGFFGFGLPYSNNSLENDNKTGGYKIKDNWETLIEQDGKIDLIVYKAKRGTGFTGNIPLILDKDKMTVSDRPENPKKKKKETQFD